MGVPSCKPYWFQVHITMGDLPRRTHMYSMVNPWVSFPYHMSPSYPSGNHMGSSWKLVPNFNTYKHLWYFHIIFCRFESIFIPSIVIMNIRVFRGERTSIEWIFGILFLIVINNCYGIGKNVWKFQVSMMKIVPVACIWSLCIIRIIMTKCFRKGDNI